MNYTDKILHFVIMALISGTLFLAFPLWLALVLCAIIAVGKEVYDCFKQNPTGFDWYDILADAIGVIYGFGISLLI